MDDERPPELEQEGDGGLAKVLAFPVGRSGTRARRRRDAPASEPVRSTVDPERRLTVLLAAIDGWDEAAESVGPDAALATLKAAAHDTLAALLAAGAGDVAIDGSPAEPVLTATFEGPDHAHLALDVAARIKDLVAQLAEPGVPLDARVGVHTGSVMDLVVGGGGPMPFRAVGTLYALAWRLMEAAEPGQVLLSVDTLGHVTSIASVHPRGEVELNRHGETREAFCLLDLRANA